MVSEIKHKSGSKVVSAILTFLVGVLPIASTLLMPHAVQATEEWRFTGSMTRPRMYHTATLLNDGRVLVVGGMGPVADTYLSAEIYNPQTETWSATQEPIYNCSLHSAVRLLDGRVLVVGYGSDRGQVFDPVSETWSLTEPMPSLIGTEANAILLNDGHVLAVGFNCVPEGRNPWEVQPCYGIYDPASNTWSAGTYSGSPPLGPIPQARLINLNDGRILAAGRCGNQWQQPSDNTVFIFDPAIPIPEWILKGYLPAERSFMAAALLGDGRILTAGGGPLPGEMAPNNTTNIFDPDTVLFGPMDDPIIPYSAPMAIGHQSTTNFAVTLSDGNALVAGGHWMDGTCEIYNYQTDTWQSAGTLQNPRTDHQVTLLSDGRVLVTGGDAWGNSLSSAEIYTPEVGPHPGISPPIIQGPASDNDGLIKVYGRTAPNASITVSDSSMGMVGSAVADGNGNWNTSIWLAPGDRILTATATISGQTSQPSVPITIVVDASVPEIGVASGVDNAGNGSVPEEITDISHLTSYSWHSIDLNLPVSNNPTSVVVNIAGNTYYPSDPDQDGIFSLTLPPGTFPSGPGTYGVSVTVTDPYGHIFTEKVMDIQLIDPSGYVYDSSTGSRLSGATVTLYTSDGIQWNASEYGQVNPQRTDESGYYGWDVPEGGYYVVASKDMYDSASSTTFNVPPPATDVNLGLTPLDNQAPVTTIIVNPSLPNGENGWYTMTPTVTLSATDNAGGSGVKTTSYKWDNSQYASYQGSPIAALEGIHTLSSYSEDLAGNKESPDNQMTVKVDTVVPAAPLIQSPANNTSFDDTVIVSGRADTGSMVQIFTDGVKVRDAQASTIDGGFVTDSIALAEGPHTLTARAKDEAGNLSVNSGQVSVFMRYTTNLTFTSDSATRGQFSDDTHIEATLKTSNGALVAGKTVQLSLDGSSMTATTGSSGIATFDLTLGLLPDAYGVNATFNGDQDNKPTSVSSNFAVEKEDTTLALVTDSIQRVGGMAHLEATLTDPDSNAGVAGKNVTMGLGTQTVTAVTDANGKADGYLVIDQNQGIYEAAASFGGCDYYLASSSAPSLYVIYDPFLGQKLTGGGWIQNGAGKCNFGLNAEYKDGASTPTGQVQYVDHGLGINMHSESMSYMVFGADTAILVGSCAVNGTGGYQFRIEATDNGSTGDSMSITITASNGSVAYEASAPLTRGSIQIR